MFGKREKQVDKVNLPIEKTPAQSNSANPDYNHSLQEFLSEDSLLVPKKAEYTSLKDFDQRIHVLKFDGLTAKKAENRPFNRYNNIYPYDYNRIVLEKPVAGSDYINGSYITGEKSTLRFNPKSLVSLGDLSDISQFSNINFMVTQGPMEKTKEQHWQVVYENEVDVIVMLTKAVEGMKEKCIEYWPSEGPPTCSGQYDISSKEENILRPGVMRRDILVMDCESMALYCEQEVAHLQYLDWPDLGVPKELDHLIKAVQDVREIVLEKMSSKRKEDKINILVHCSAGVGRTGTFLALYKLMEDVDEILKNSDSTSSTSINIYNTVFALRSKRVEMVQTWEQYKYLYGSVCIYARQKKGLPKLEDESIYVI